MGLVDAANRRTLLPQLYQLMWEVRAFDLKVQELFGQGRLPGFLHSCVGQEASAAGIVTQLLPDDFVLTTHRGHGHCLAKGADPKRMMAELFGRATGYCHGKGGSMHVCDLQQGILGANGIVGAGIPIAAGVGTGIKLKGGNQVVVCYFGDGAANEGDFHEGMNLAALWGAPVIYVCENNQYAQFTHQRMHTRVADIHLRAAAYGMPGVVVDGNDLIAVYDTAATAIAHARSGGGPTLIECKTYRWTGHSVNNPAGNLGRDQNELAEWKARDPIARFERYLLENGLASEAEIAQMRGAAEATIEAAVAYAAASPPPDPQEALTDVYGYLPEGRDL